MNPIEMLRSAANLSEEDVNLLASELGWPELTAVRRGVELYLSEYRNPAHFLDGGGDAERLGPLVEPIGEGRLRVTHEGVCVVSLRLLAEDTAAADRRTRAETKAGEAFMSEMRQKFGTI